MFLEIAIPFGDTILEFIDTYFTSQSDLNRILIVFGLGFLSILGLGALVKGVLKKTAGLVKVILILAIVYYVVIVLMGVDILGLIKG